MKSNPIFYLMIFLAAALLGTACGRAPDTSTSLPPTSTELPLTASPDGNEEGLVGMPNPASFYCEEMGYQLKMEDTEEGTRGICVFHDGNQCEEWDFLSGRCGQRYSYCELQGFDLVEAGNIGNCVFDDGSTCPEYMFFIGECQPPEDG